MYINNKCIFAGNKSFTNGILKKDNGSSVKIVCDSFGEVSWYSKRGDTFKYIPVHEKTLTLKSITPDNSGIYICHGTYRWNIFTKSFFQQTRLKVFSKFLKYTRSSSIIPIKMLQPLAHKNKNYNVPLTAAPRNIYLN